MKLDYSYVVKMIKDIWGLFLGRGNRGYSREIYLIIEFFFIFISNQLLIRVSFEWFGCMFFVIVLGLVLFLVKGFILFGERLIKCRGGGWYLV